MPMPGEALHLLPFQRISPVLAPQSPRIWHIQLQIDAYLLHTLSLFLWKVSPNNCSASMSSLFIEAYSWDQSAAHLGFLGYANSAEVESTS
jgi:hypothetical protein